MPLGGGVPFIIVRANTQGRGKVKPQAYELYNMLENEPEMLDIMFDK